MNLYNSLRVIKALITRHTFILSLIKDGHKDYFFYLKLFIFDEKQ